MQVDDKMIEDYNERIEYWKSAPCYQAAVSDLLDLVSTLCDVLNNNDASQPGVEADAAVSCDMNHKLRLKILGRFQTQSDFAIEIEEHESKISQVVRGRRELNPEAQDAWAEALGCSKSEIFPRRVE